MTEHHTFKGAFMPPGEPVTGKTYRADGWAYADFPRMPPRRWDEMIEALGDEVVALTLADYGKSKRGQLLISPEGLLKLAAWNEAIKTETWDT